MKQAWFESLWKAAVIRHLKQLRGGQIALRHEGKTEVFGEGSADLRATLTVHDPDFFRRIALGGGLGAAESLMDGQWSCDDLMALVRIFIRNTPVATGLDWGWARFAQYLERIGHWRRRNNVANARQNIHQHYDLGNSFFKLFLDETLSYSCAVFESEDMPLREASWAKLRTVSHKLDLQPADHLLEIGTGWGSLAIHAAATSGCRVTTTTISAEQHALATERVNIAGLSQKISVEQLDYRHLQGQFDKLVSIEMIEAVGKQYLDTYFRQCASLLKPDGVMLLQAIVIRDQVLERHSQSVDFIGKYIFPGGFLPSVTAIADSVSRCTDLRICHLDEMAPHYVQTLQAWRAQFWRNIDQVRALGFDERFIRMWDYYFEYCAAAFAERQVNVVQILLGKPGYAGPPFLMPTPQRSKRPLALEAARLEFSRPEAGSLVN
jgi:cyclopropane-fatty-acyl-phospholipid synthase